MKYLTILSLIALSVGAYLWLKIPPEEEKKDNHFSIESIPPDGEVTITVEKNFKVPVEECGEKEKCF